MAIALLALVAGCREGGGNHGDNDGANSNGHTPGAVLLEANATDDQVCAAFNAVTGRSVGRADILIYRPAEFAEVYLITDMPMPDAGDPARHGAFIGGKWHADADVQAALFASLGYAGADAAEREDIVRRWATHVLGSPDAPRIETQDDGTVRVQVHLVGEFNIAGDPLIDEWVEYRFDTQGTRVAD